MEQSKTAQLFSSMELMNFICRRVQILDEPKIYYKLRVLNKEGQKKIEKGINTTKINIHNLEQLINTSHIRLGIKYLQVFVRAQDDHLDEFKYLSITYFPNIQNIDVFISSTFCEQARVFITLKICEPLIFKNLNVTNRSTLYGLEIIGNFDVTIQDCKFIGFQVACIENGSVSVTGSQFINSNYGGFGCIRCISLYMDTIVIKNAAYGLQVVDVKQDIKVNDIQVNNCQGNGICFFRNRANFALCKAFVKDCNQIGIWVIGPCHGEIQNANIQRCRRAGIQLHEGAKVRYRSIEFNGNQQDVGLRNDDDDGSEFQPHA